MSRAESEVVLIGELEYKVVTIGETEFSRYKPTDEWRCSTKPVSEIRKAIDNARAKAAGEVIVDEQAKLKAKKKSSISKPGRKPSTPDVLKALKLGPQTMRELRRKTGYGPTAIRSALERLGSKISSKSVVRQNAWTTRSTVTIWELV